MSNGAILLGQKDAAINSLRFQAASTIAGHLIPQQLAAAARRAQLAAGVPEGTPTPFDAAEALDSATNLALATADMLFEKVFGG